MTMLTVLTALILSCLFKLTIQTPRDFLVSEEYDPIHYPEYSKHCTQSKFKTQQTFRRSLFLDNLDRKMRKRVAAEQDWENNELMKERVVQVIRSADMEDDNDEKIDIYNLNLEEEKSKKTCALEDESCSSHQVCCFRSTCSCNIWGENCRCRPVGVLPRWGK